MKSTLLYQFNLEKNTFFVFHYETPIFHRNGTIYFCTDDLSFCPRNHFACKKISFNGQVETIFGARPPKNKTEHWSGWKLFLYNDHVILSCGNNTLPTPTRIYLKNGPWPVRELPPNPEANICTFFLDLDDGMKEVILPDSIMEENRCLETIDEWETLYFSDCIIKYKNSRRYQCYNLSGELIWEEKHKGCRWTPVEEKNGCFIFGTAGQGGGLYCYRRTDGECLCAVDTKGTPFYTWHNDLILTKGREGQLLFVDPFTGKIVDSLFLDALLLDESHFYSDGRYISLVAFEKKTKSPCIYLVDTQG